MWTRGNYISRWQCYELCHGHLANCWTLSFTEQVSDSQPLLRDFIKVGKHYLPIKANSSLQQLYFVFHLLPEYRATVGIQIMDKSSIQTTEVCPMVEWFRIQMEV